MNRAILFAALAVALTACPSPSPDPGPTDCVPATCAGLGKDCGAVPDGCGGSIECGSCASPSTCGGGGTANVCGCTPESDAELCAGASAQCGEVTATDRCGGSKTVDCGTCTAPEQCGGGGVANQCGCRETEAEFCARLGASCGAVTAQDACGVSRTVECGTCTLPQTCSGQNVCACVPETNAAFCGRLGKECGAVTASDNCGSSRTATCGSCTSPETCNAQNVCACVPETNAAFCGRLGKECGAVTASDNCGSSRTATCGSCTSPETCNAQNVCACVPETNTAFCGRLGKECGSVTASDNCGSSRTATCGSCTSPETCNAQNVCACVPETNTAFCGRLGKECGTVSTLDNCGAGRTVSCGTCTSPETCNAQNVCACVPETDAVFCSRLGKDCGAVSAQDNCGGVRTAACGSCSSPQSCGGAGVPNVCGAHAGSYAWSAAGIGYGSPNAGSNLLYTRPALNHAAVDAAGNVYVTGAFFAATDFGGTTLNSAGSADAFLVKYTPAGQIAWAKRFGDSRDDRGWAVAVDGSGNVYATGKIEDRANFGGGWRYTYGYLNNGCTGCSAPYLAKFAADGTHLWSRVLQAQGSFDKGDGLALGVDPTTSDVLLAGEVSGPVDFGAGFVGTNGRDAFLARYSPAGSLAWARTLGASYSGTPYDELRGVAVAADGTIGVAGAFGQTLQVGSSVHTSAGASDLFVAAFRPDGTLAWSAAAGGAGEDVATSISAGGNGFVVAGWFSSAITVGSAILSHAGGTDAFVAHFGPTGAVSWARSFGSVGNDDAAAVAVDATGHVLIAGTFESVMTVGTAALTSQGAQDAWVARLDGAGAPLWTRRYGGAGSDRGLGVGVDAQGRVAVIGRYNGIIDLGAGPVSSGFSAPFWAPFVVLLGP